MITTAQSSYNRNTTTRCSFAGQVLGLRSSSGLGTGLRVGFSLFLDGLRAQLQMTISGSLRGAGSPATRDRVKFRVRITVGIEVSDRIRVRVNILVCLRVI